eukprot:5972787-Alexandrium_andersonii.AAC.1
MCIRDRAQRERATRDNEFNGRQRLCSDRTVLTQSHSRTAEPLRRSLASSASSLDVRVKGRLLLTRRRRRSQRLR